MYLYTYNLYLSDLASAHVAVVNTVRSLTITPLHEYFISPVNVSESEFLAEHSQEAHVSCNERSRFSREIYFGYLQSETRLSAIHCIYGVAEIAHARSQ